MELKKVKRFVKEHKKELLIGGAGVVIGCVVMKRRSVSKDELALLDALKTFGLDEHGVSLVKNINKCQEGALCAKYFIPNHELDTDRLASGISEHFAKTKPNVTGAIIFTK